MDINGCRGDVFIRIAVQCQKALTPEKSVVTVFGFA